MANIAEKLKLIALSSDVNVYYGNIKDNDDVKKALDIFKNVDINYIFK